MTSAENHQELLSASEWMNGIPIAEAPNAYHTPGSPLAEPQDLRVVITTVSQTVADADSKHPLTLVGLISPLSLNVIAGTSPVDQPHEQDIKIHAALCNTTALRCCTLRSNNQTGVFNVD